MIKLRKIKNRFRKTLLKVSKFLNIPPEKINRDDYVRICVDLDIKDRLNKEELNFIGGFSEAKGLLMKKGKIKRDLPRILLLDIETCPMEAYVWGLWDVTVGLSMLKEDWSVLSWAAKWLGDSPDKIMYEDVSGQKNLRDDKKVLKRMWKLLDEADIVVGQNSTSFDIKKLNARFIQNGMKPPSSFKQYDTKRMAKRYFSFTSNKLEYMTDKLCTKYKKLKHGKFPGFALWREFLNRNPEVILEMEEYNRYDVLSLEELFLKLLPWDSTIDWNGYIDNSDIHICTCGSIDFNKKGFHHTNTGKYQKYVCNHCGKESRDRTNLLSKEKRKNTIRSRCSR